MVGVSWWRWVTLDRSSEKRWRLTGSNASSNAKLTLSLCPSSPSPSLPRFRRRQVQLHSVNPVTFAPSVRCRRGIGEGLESIPVTVITAPSGRAYDYYHLALSAVTRASNRGKTRVDANFAKLCAMLRKLQQPPLTECARLGRANDAGEENREWARSGVHRAPVCCSLRDWWELCCAQLAHRRWTCRCWIQVACIKAELSGNSMKTVGEMYHLNMIIDRELYISSWFYISLCANCISENFNKTYLPLSARGIVAR